MYRCHILHASCDAYQIQKQSRSQYDSDYWSSSLYWIYKFNIKPLVFVVRVMSLGWFSTSYHMATRALANLSHKGDKLAKRLRGHVITGLLQFKILLCRITTEWTRPTFLWISTNDFLFGNNRWNAKAYGIKSDLSVNNGAFQTEYELKTFLRSTDWALKVHLA